MHRLVKSDRTGAADKPRVVIITGSSAGETRDRTRVRKNGAHVGLLARGGDGLEGAYREVEEVGGKALVLPTDVADANAVHLTELLMKGY